MTRALAIGLVAGLSSSAFAQTPVPVQPAPDPAPTPTPVPVTPDPSPAAPPDPEPERKSTMTVQAAPDDNIASSALLFNLNNIFTNGAVLGGWQGFGVGVQRALANGMNARIGIDLARVTDPVNIVKTTRQNGMDVVTSYELQLPASGFSAIHAAAATLDLIKPLTSKSMAPYLGAGVFVAYLDRRLEYTDDVTVTDQVTDVNNKSDTLSTGLRGILGVSWRVNERFSLFAEYTVRLEAFAWTEDVAQTTVSNSVGGTPASSSVTTETEETRLLNLDLGLTQGGALGLLAHF